MADMHFKTNLLPNSDLGYSLGSSTKRWKINGVDNPVFTDANVTQTNQTGNNDYRILLSGSANDTTATEGSNKNTNLRFNPSTQLLSVGGSISATGNLTLTGNANLNGQTYAESISTGSLLVSGGASFTQIPTSPTPATTSNDSSIATTAFVKNNLGGLSGAMHFKGTTTTTMSDGLTTAAVTISGSSYTPEAGDVVLYSDSEYVWTGSLWERLGRDSSFKTTQTAITDSTGTSESTTATRFVYSVSQDANGVISVKTRPLPTYSNNVGTVTSVQVQATSPVVSSVSTASSTTLSTTISLADNYGDTKNPYASKTAKYVLAAPNASNGAPTFRQLSLSDLSGVSDLSAIEALSGTSGLLKKTAADTWTLDTNTYATSASVHSIPSGGSAGYMLAKNSATDYDVTWTEPLFARGTGTYAIQSINLDAQPVASGAYSIALGGQSEASGISSLAAGTKVSGQTYGPRAQGAAAIAFGGSTLASANYTLAIGNKSQATNTYAFAGGAETQASGLGSFAYGAATVASGNTAIALNRQTIAAGRAQTAIGQYNIEDTTAGDETTYGSGAKQYLFIIGNGTSAGVRSNAMTVDWGGNVTATSFVGQLNGTLSPTAVAIANGDALAIIDSSNSNKVTPTTITFDGSTDTKALTQKGTWETFNNYAVEVVRLI